MIRSGKSLSASATVWALAAAMLLSLGSLCRAAMPQLPADAITEDTVSITYLNGAKFTSENLKASLAAVLGPEAVAKDADFKKFENDFTELSKDGADAAIVTVPFVDPKSVGAGQSSDDVQAASIVAFIHLKPGANEDALRQDINKEMDPEDQKTAQISRSGDFLVLRKKGAAPPAAASAARASQFSAAFAYLEKAGEQAAISVLIPNDKLRAQMDKQLPQAGEVPPAVIDALKAALAGKWQAVTLTLGDSPALAATVNAADVASADALKAKAQAAIDQSKQPDPNDPTSQVTMMLLKPVFNGIKITEDTTHVCVSVDLKPLSGLARMFMSIQRAQSGGTGPSTEPAPDMVPLTPMK